MFYVEMIDQISFAISVCFSFSIFVLAIIFKKSDILPRILGFSFSVIFIFKVISFLSGNEEFSSALSLIAEPLLLLIIFILLVTKPSENQFKTISTAILSFSVILIMLINGISPVKSFLSVPENCFLFLIVLLILNLYILKKEDGIKNMLFFAMLPLAAGAAIGSFLGKSYLSYTTPVLYLISYLLFLKYFHSEFYKKILIKLGEAEKKASIVNRSIDAEVKKRIMEIERVNQNLVNISKIDPLSKIFNKAAVLDSIENLITTKAKSEFSVLMFDIDDFKSINDTMGHVAGDKCIKLLATIAKNNLREFDIVGRYGGDEFIIVLPGTTIHQALQIAERFRKKIELTESPHFTISIGIASYPKDGITVKELIDNADKGLYKSKKKGKNSISHYDSY